MSKVILITGASSGIGKKTATFLASKGYKVYTMSRRLVSDSDHIINLQGDVTNIDDIKKVKEIIENNGDVIDILINNAGFGISGSAEFTSLEDIKKQFEVNTFAVFSMCQIFLPMLRKTKGRIINISSVAGAIPIPFQSFYSASKAAINSYTMSLANEVKAFNVSVTAFMLGDTKTSFTDVRNKNNEGDDIYKGKINASVSKMEKDERNGMEPIYIAKQIYKIIKKKKVKPIYTSRFDYKLLVVLSRILPIRFVNWIIGKLYA